MIGKELFKTVIESVEGTKMRSQKMIDNLKWVEPMKKLTI